MASTIKRQNKPACKGGLFCYTLGMAKYNITNLPRCLDQGNKGACQSFAIAALAEYYIQQKGNYENVDEWQIFNDTERNGATNLTNVFRYGQERGIPTMQGNKYKIKEAGPIKKDVLSIMTGIDMFQCLIIAYALHDGDPFLKRLDADYVLSRPPLDTHAMVLTGYDFDNKVFRVQSSWGKSFGKNGCFDIPYVLMRKKYLQEIFYFIMK